MAPGDPPLRLFLIRHGETEWTLCGRHTGRTDIPLTARGEDAARALGRCLRGIPFARVLTSPRQRARRTCELAGLGPAENEPNLVEWDYGDYEGRESVDIRGERPDWDLFRDGCPGGELPAQVADRADRLIARLRAQDGNVALFSHGQFGSVLATRWTGLPVIEAQHFPLATASLSILAYDPHHAVVPILALWNTVSAEVFDSGSYPRLGVGMTMKRRALERWEGEGGATPADHRANHDHPPRRACPSA